MATRREFLTTGAAIATAFSSTKARSDVSERTSSAADDKRNKTSETTGNRSSFRLHLVGCGYPPPYGIGAQTRHGSAFLLEVGAELLMVDCGPGTTYKMARMGIDTRKVNHVFLTHHHFDHNVDFPCFALVRWDLCSGKEPPLRVYGPPPTRLFVDQLLGENGAFHPDWNSRVKHPVSIRIFETRGGTAPRPAPSFDVREIGTGKVEKTRSWTVTAASVHHVEPTLTSLAYRFDTESGSVVFAGDCGDCPELRTLAQGADTLVIACVRIGDTNRYDGIVPGTDAVCAIAETAAVRRVVLTHNGGANSPAKQRPFVEAVRKTFTGEVLFPDELTTIDLPI